MKVTELMIGDWVKVNDIEYTHPLQVAEIFMKCGAPYATLFWDGMPGDSMPETLYADIDKVLPLPITAKLLKKNGFKYDELDEGLSWEEANGIEISQEVRLVFDGDVWLCDLFGINCDMEIEEMKLHYIHELQHLMRCVGITKEIERV